MPLSAFCLALGAAFLHATWNVLLAGARDSETATAVATLCGVVLLAPVALATGDVSDAALPFAGDLGRAARRLPGAAGAGLPAAAR